MGAAKADAIYLAAVEVLAAAAEIGAVGHAFSSVEAVRQDFASLLRQFVSRCRQWGIPDPEIAEARYALVAFIDDRILASDWAGRSEWMSNPFQLQFFQEFAAGENFFARMRALAQRDGPGWALEVYFMCVALGFTGAAGGAKGGSHAARAYANAALTRLLGGANPARIAPHAVPVERLAPARRPFPVGLATAIGCALVCALGLLALKSSLGTTIARARGALDAAPRAQAASTGGP